MRYLVIFIISFCFILIGCGDDDGVQDAATLDATIEEVLDAANTEDGVIVSDLGVEDVEVVDEAAVTDIEISQDVSEE